jgi:hypothetical protein
LLRISGQNAKKPRDIIRKQIIDICLIFEGLFFQRTRLNKGEKNKRKDGCPMIKCIRRGNGNIAAPAIDIENDRIIKTGITFNLNFLHNLYKPITNRILRIEHKTKPDENTN